MITSADKKFSKQLEEYLTNCDLKDINSIDKNIKSMLDSYINNDGFKVKRIKYTEHLYESPSLDVEVRWENSTGEQLYTNAIIRRAKQ